MEATGPAVIGDNSQGDNRTAIRGLLVLVREDLMEHRPRGLSRCKIGQTGLLGRVWSSGLTPQETGARGPLLMPTLPELAALPACMPGAGPHSHDKIIP